MSLYTGATTFQVVDVSLPGNNGLAVELRRSFSVESRDGPSQAQLLSRDGTFAEWDLDLPHLGGIFAWNEVWTVDSSTTAGKGKRCSLLGANSPQPPMVEGSPHGLWAPTEYWHGNSLHMPGEGRQEMLLDAVSNTVDPSDGKTYVWLTNNHWRFSCLPRMANGVPGEAFLAVDPAGRRYYFDWLVSRAAPFVTKPNGAIIDPLSVGPSGLLQPMANPDPDISGLTRVEVRILPTRIEDRHGNHVTYTYDPAHPWRLLSVVASDGRSIALSYDSAGRISAATAGSRRWAYAYANGLTEVHLPDQRKWMYDFSDLRAMRTLTSSDVTSLCERAGSGGYNQPLRIGTVTHPSGAVGTFGFRSKLHGRSYVPRHCMSPVPNRPLINFALYPHQFDTASIEHKQISGPGIVAPLSWAYVFGVRNTSWQENCAGRCPAIKTLDVTGPDNTWTRYTFGNRFRYNEGLLLKVERGVGPGSVLDSVETSYQTDTSGQGYSAQVGLSIYGRGDGVAELLIPVWRRVHTRQHRTFTWQVPATCGGNGATLCFDRFARPTKVTKSSAPSP